VKAVSRNDTLGLPALFLKPSASGTSARFWRTGGRVNTEPGLRSGFHEARIKGLVLSFLRTETQERGTHQNEVN
jgi:hypothetical protein